MKTHIWIALFILCAILQSCKCANVDCASTMSFTFKIINKDTGNDLIFDENVEISEIKFMRIDGVLPDIYRGVNTLNTNLESSEKSYTIVYKAKTYKLEFDFLIEMRDNECCDDRSIKTLTLDNVVIKDSLSIYKIPLLN